MKKTFAAIAIFLQVLPLLTTATLQNYVDPKDVAIIDGRRYYFSSIWLNIPDAVTVCQELNMTLVGLETQQEYDAVVEYIRINLGGTADCFWTSGTRYHTMWIWGNSGEPFSYFRWNVGQPNGGAQNVLCFTNGLMHDSDATVEQRFVCEEKSCPS